MDASGGNPLGPGVTTCSGEKSTVAGKTMVPSRRTVTRWVAPLPRAFRSFCDTEEPQRCACPESEASVTTNHTSPEGVTPWCSGRVTVWSALTVALGTKTLASCALADGAMARLVVASAAVRTAAAAGLLLMVQLLRVALAAPLQAGTAR